MGLVEVEYLLNDCVGHIVCPGVDGRSLVAGSHDVVCLLAGDV